METLPDNWKCDWQAWNITTVQILFATIALQSSKWTVDLVVCLEKQPRIEMLINSRIELSNTMHMPKV